MAGRDAVFVFCEGDHDVAFCHLILKHQLKAKRIGTSDLCAPSPVDTLVKTYLSRCIGDPEISYLRYSHLYLLDDQYVFLYKSGGKEKSKLVKKLIVELLPFVGEGEFSQLGLPAPDNGTDLPGLRNVRFLFVYDHDEKSLDGLTGWWLREYQQMEDCPNWQIAKTADKTFAKGKIYGDKAVFGWSAGADTNTLEDILTSVFGECTDFPVKRATEFVHSGSGWAWSPAGDSPREISAAKAREGKAILAVSGQNLCPGGSYAVVVQDCLKSGLAKKDDAQKVSKFLENRYVQEFATFLMSFMTRA